MERAWIPEKRFMLRALELARQAAGEVPVGAVVVRDGSILGEGRNRQETAQTPLAHAEMEAIAQACRKIGSRRLTGCHLYVTLEPCPMCTGAILNAQLSAVIFGAEDVRLGCCGGAMDLLSLPAAPKIQVFPGFLEDECRELIQNFFRDLRSR